MTTTLADWQPFFAALLGAGATLLGLLFVGLSLNLARIVATTALPRRAEIALMVIVLQIVVAAFGLVPAQPNGAFAAETLLAAGAIWAATTSMNLGLIRTAETEQRRTARQNFALLQLAVLPYLAGGLLMLAGRTPALYLIAAGMVACILKATLDAWVLLVEINR
ncbi:MAG: hypothetical protein U1E59_03710 [Amaricoccus sp.]